ncbi:MAG: serine/threonine protein kinase [Deltaproteobacteria bacterium]|nr:serine/threonine protein kinase [Deltaproteobacteria bacterium]
MRVGPYELEHVLGQGGMGTVHAARHRLLGSRVAIKELHHPDPAARALLLDEARLLFGRKHPSFPTVLDLVEAHGRAWLVMDFVEGPTLRAVAEARPLLPAETILLGQGLCGALEYLHAGGVLHRDVKPDNILLPRGLADPVLVDLGIAGRVGSSGAVAFTPGLAPPEQEQGLPCTAASDVYQVAATLLWCATGTLPPGASSRHHDDDLGAGFAGLNARAPGLAATLAHGLRLAPALRPLSARALAAALGRAAAPVPAPPLQAAPRRGMFDIRR